MTIAPYDTFDTSDGVLVLAIGNDAQWRRFCAALDRADLAADARFASNADRVTHYEALRAVLQSIFARDARQSWIDRLRAADVPCGSVRSISEALADPQIAAREMIASVDHPLVGPLELLGVPTKLSDSPAVLRAAPPRLGEHTATVLANDLGLGRAEIAALAAAGVVRVMA